MPQLRHHCRAFLIPILAAVVTIGAVCHSSAGVAAPLGPNLARGTWGGENAGAVVTDSQTHVHIGCTFGDIPGLVPVSSDGSFSIAGSYIVRAYPITVGPSLPARFDGRVQQSAGSSTLTLTVVVNDTVEKKTQTLGPVTVTFGKEPSMGPCPICRVPRRPL